MLTTKKNVLGLSGSLSCQQIRRALPDVEPMVMFDDDQDNYCEGCMTRNTGDNFSHAALCKSCMTGMMGMDTTEILEGKDALTKTLADNADTKVGALRTWKDTDGLEVEIMLPLPPGTIKKDLRVKVNNTKLLVAAGDRRLLFVDPLYDENVVDEMVWTLETKDGVVTHMQISLTKKHMGAPRRPRRAVAHRTPCAAAGHPASVAVPGISSSHTCV